MAKTTYVYKNGRVVEKPSVSSKASKSVHVISDTMAETRHMADGTYYTSKKKFREATRASGCIEVGNEAQTLLKPRKVIQLSRQDRREAIRHSIQLLMGKS